MTKYESLLADATQLPIADRIELIEALWESVPGGSRPALSEEWLAEINRRSSDYDSGKVETVSSDTIKAEALLRLARKTD